MKINIPIINKKPPRSNDGVKDSSEPKRKKSLHQYLVYISFITFLCILLSTVFLIAMCLKPVTVEVGETPDYSHITSNILLSMICKVNTDISYIDTSDTQETEIPMLLFGFIDGNSKLSIVDTVRPDIKAQNVCVTVGTEIVGEMFVRELKDKTQVSFDILTAVSSLESCIDKKVSISVTDKSGNNVVFDSRLTVVDPKNTLIFEYGVKDDEIASAVLSIFPEIENLDLSAIEGCGKFMITGSYENTAYYITVSISDTDICTRVCLDVTNIMQKPALPNGCEVVSLAIALKYAGHPVDPVVLYDNYMPESPLRCGDPWTTFVGNAKGNGYGCYAPCIVTTGNAYLLSIGSQKRVFDVSGQSLSYYERLIDRGTPVIMWGMTEMNENSKVCWDAIVNGKHVKWHSYSHCLVLIGYTDNTYIFCDPLKGIAEYTKLSVETSFNINYKQACIIR